MLGSNVVNSYFMPGYGFLSENTVFVSELEKAGVKFIGKLLNAFIYVTSWQLKKYFFLNIFFKFLLH
jgi:hypothetical protein